MSYLDYVTGHQPHKRRKGIRSSGKTKNEDDKFFFRLRKNEGLRIVTFRSRIDHVRP